MGVKEKNLRYWPKVNNREMNSPQQVTSVIYLVSHNGAHLQEQTAQNVKQSFLSKYIWNGPPLPWACFILLHLKSCFIFFFFFFFQSPRSISSRIDKKVNVPAGGTVTSWWECVMLVHHRRGQYVAVLIRVLMCNMHESVCRCVCVHVYFCVRRCMYIFTGVTDRLLGNKTIS